MFRLRAYWIWTETAPRAPALRASTCLEGGSGQWGAVVARDNGKAIEVTLSSYQPAAWLEQHSRYAIPRWNTALGS